MRCEVNYLFSGDYFDCFFPGNSSSFVLGADEAQCRCGWQIRCGFPGIQKFSGPSESMFVFLGGEKRRDDGIDSL